MSKVKLGLLAWNQYTDWPALRDVAIRADRLGYDSIWAWDHLYPIVGDPNGPFYEGWLTLAAWAASTKNIRLGLMVGATLGGLAGSQSLDLTNNAGLGVACSVLVK